MNGSSSRTRRKSFSLFRERDQNQNTRQQEDNSLFLNDDNNGNNAGEDASQISQHSSGSRRKSFNIFRGEKNNNNNNGQRRSADSYLIKDQIDEVYNEFNEDEEDEIGLTPSDLSFHDRKKSIQSQVKDLKLLKHKEAASLKYKIEKIKGINSKKTFYITRLNTSLSKLQVNTNNKQKCDADGNLVTIDAAFGESFESDNIPSDVTPVMNDYSMGSSKHTLHNSIQAITAFVKPRKDEEIEELNEITERLINAWKKKVSLCKTLNLSLSTRESSISDLESIVQSHAGVIEKLRKDIDISSIDDSSNNHQSSVEERYLSVSMQLNESQRSETQIADDIKVMRESMSKSIHKIKNLDKESETSTFECGKLGARNVFLRTNSVRIVDEVKTVYATKKDVETTVMQLRSYLGLIAKLESYFLKQISKFVFEEEGMDAIVDNVNFFLGLASEFNSLVQDTTVILELLEAVEEVHPELLEAANVYQFAEDIIKLCLSVENPVVASLLSMKAMLTLMLGSLSKDDEFFTSLETMRKDIKASIEQDYASDKRRISYSNLKNSLSVPDTTRIVLEYKFNQKCMEVATLEEQCKNLNATAERLLDVCVKNSTSVK